MHGVVLPPRKSFTRLTNGTRLAKPSCWRGPYELPEVFGTAHHAAFETKDGYADATSATPASDGVACSPRRVQSGLLSFLLVFLLVLLKSESKKSSIHAGWQRFFDSVPALFLEHSRSLKTRYCHR